MSRPNIKFTYSGEIKSEVQPSQRSTFPLQNSQGSYSQSQNEHLLPQNKINHFAYPPLPIISNQEINSTDNLQTLRRYRSSDNFPPLARQTQQYEANTPIINIEDIQQSEQQIISQKQSNTGSKASNKNIPEQIVLKAPSYKYTPKKEGQIVHSKKDYKKTSSVERPINAEIVLKSKKQLKNSNGQKQIKLKSSNPMFQVQTVKQSDFNLEPETSATISSKTSKKQETFENSDEKQIVLKAPKYKYTPGTGGTKKQYVKSEHIEKYLYEGVQTHREKDFVSCFGCSQPKTISYKHDDV